MKNRAPEVRAENTKENRMTNPEWKETARRSGGQEAQVGVISGGVAVSDHPANLYRRRGKPERVMAEIRRTLLRKISARFKKERAEANLLKESAPMGRI
jgi:hypothetical protein